MSCSSYSLPSSLDSLFTVQFKLTTIWKSIQYSNPLLANLVDVNDVSDAPITIIEDIKVEAENILKKLGMSIILQLLKIENKFYIQLSAADANVRVEMSSAKNNEEAVDITTYTEEIALLDKPIENSDDSAVSERNILQCIKWPSTLFTVVKTALENFSSEPRYSKEACIIHSPSSVIDSILAIERGEVLAVKIYRPRMHGIFLTSFYHFGVYVGKMTTKNGEELEHAVIELTKTKETGSISINAVPLEGYEKGTCFVMKETKSGHLPLLFKVIYGKQSLKDKDETANRALNFYNNSERYLKKYSLVSNNCEHFVNMCAFGAPHCEQHVRAIMTTLPSFFKGTPAAIQVVRYLLITVAELIEAASKTSGVMSYLGESIALTMLMIEYTGRIFWDIYLLKKSDRLTLKNVLYLIKRRTFSIAPEMFMGIGFLLIAILCTFSGPIGAIIGISGTIITVLLRYIARPRIERWIERREIERLQDFLQWYPHEVARLAMDTSEENDTFNEVLINFESKQLSGKAMSELVNQKHENTLIDHLANAFPFLNANRLKLLEQNLKGILGHFDLSEQLKSSINLTYEERSFSIKIPNMSTITVSELLNIARLNWQIDFEKGQWQVNLVALEDEQKTVIASYIIPNSITEKIETIPDSPTTIELVYNEPASCTLL